MILVIDVVVSVVVIIEIVVSVVVINRWCGRYRDGVRCGCRRGGRCRCRRTRLRGRLRFRRRIPVRLWFGLRGPFGDGFCRSLVPGTGIG